MLEIKSAAQMFIPSYFVRQSLTIHFTQSFCAAWQVRLQFVTLCIPEVRAYVCSYRSGLYGSGTQYRIHF